MLGKLNTTQCHVIMMMMIVKTKVNVHIQNTKTLLLGLTVMVY